MAHTAAQEVEPRIHPLPVVQDLDGPLDLQVVQVGRGGHEDVPSHHRPVQGMPRGAALGVDHAELGPPAGGCGRVLPEDRPQQDAVLVDLDAVPQDASLHETVRPDADTVPQDAALDHGRGMDVTPLALDHETGGDLVLVQGEG